MTWFRVGGAGIPASLKNNMNSVLNKKFGTTGQNYPPNGWPDDVNLLGPLPEKTVAGAIANFSDGADDVPLKSIECSITPQGGNGTPSSPVAITGISSFNLYHGKKNLLPMVNYDGGVYNPDVGRQLNLTVSETQFNKNGNVYSVSTTSTWKTYTVLFPLVPGATYFENWTLSAVDGQIGASRAYLDEDFNVLAKTPYNVNPIVISQRMQPPKGAKYLSITFTNRDTANQTLYITEPQIEIGTSASTFEEYSLPESEVVSVGSPVYGVSYKNDGTLTERYFLHKVTAFLGKWDSSNPNGNCFYFSVPGSNHVISSDENMKSNMLGFSTNARTSLPLYSYSSYDGASTTHTICLPSTVETIYDANAWLSGLSEDLYIICKRSTPVETQANPFPVMNSYYGTNNFWTDIPGGETSVAYRKDIDLALQAVSSSRGLMMASRPVTQLVGEESDPDQVNELVEDDENDIPEQLNEVVENDKTEQEGDNDAR